MRGLALHKSMPMPGVHKTVHSDSTINGSNQYGKGALTKYRCKVFTIFEILFIFLLLSGCSDSTFDLGSWNHSNEKHKYAFLSLDDEKRHEKELNEFKLKLKDLKLLPLGIVSHREAGLKSIGKPPKFIVTNEDGVFVTVNNYGYVFLQISKNIIGNYDDIEWAWKMTIENNSKYMVSANIKYGLMDENGFILTTSRDFPN